MLKGKQPKDNTFLSNMNSQIFNNQLSLYIPRVTVAWRDQVRITKIFQDYDIGAVSRVDFVDKVDPQGRAFCHAFVHFHAWYNNLTTQHIQERIADPERQARMVYDDPKYWILLANRNPLTESEKAVHDRLYALELQAAGWSQHTQRWLSVIMETQQQLLERLTALEAAEVEWAGRDDDAPPLTMEQLAQQSAEFAQSAAESFPLGSLLNSPPATPSSEEDESIPSKRRTSAEEHEYCCKLVAERGWLDDVSLGSQESERSRTHFPHAFA
jgi:hypothetical protein